MKASLNIIVALMSLPSATVFSQETGSRKLVAETNHSTIAFSVPISGGLTRITGKFTKFAIDLDYVGNDITQSKLSVKIEVASINTGIPDRDADLRTPTFFDAEKYPDIEFTTDLIEKRGENYVATGTMKMHGEANVISIPFRITGQKSENVIGLTSRFTVKRSDFGVGTKWKHTTDDNFISDEIGVEVDFWTKKSKPVN